MIHAGTCRFQTRSAGSSAAMAACRIMTSGIGVPAAGLNRCSGVCSGVALASAFAPVTPRDAGSPVGNSPQTVRRTLAESARSSFGLRGGTTRPFRRQRRP